MANIVLTWKMPTKRTDGRTLARSEIADVIVEMSADQGATFVEIGRVNDTTFRQTELEPGTYHFRLSVVDTQAVPRLSAPVVVDGTVPIPVLAAPETISDVVVTIE